MASFTFADFTIFAGTANVNEDMYVTISKGVINYVKTRYGVYLEPEIASLSVFSTSGQLSFLPKAYPINSIDSISYDSATIDATDYSYYGEDILLLTAVEDIRKPLTFSLDVGYAADTYPDDLVLAVYRHILAVYQAIDKHTDTLTKSINSDGNTSYFSHDVVPPASRETYQFYAGNTLLSF